MARRGTPLPLSLREQIRRLRVSGESLRKIACAVGVAVDTARKYSGRGFDMAQTSDFGGHNHGRASCKKVTKQSCRSYRCRDCNHLRYVTHVELSRAAAPRCTFCGGSLEETDPSFKHNTGKTKRRVEIESNHGCPGEKPHECHHCRKRFRSEGGLAIHIKESHPGSLVQND